MQAYPLGYTDVAVVENARLFMKRLEIGPMDRLHRNKTRIAITDRTDSSDFFGLFFPQLVVRASHAAGCDRPFFSRTACDFSQERGLAQQTHSGRRE